MTDPVQRDPVSAEVIQNSAMALAAYASQQLARHRGAAPEASETFRWWQSYLASRLHDLAAAVHLGRPQLFITQAVWCHEALAAMDMPTAPLRDGLRALAEVLRDELGNAGQAIAQAYLHPAADRLNTPGQPDPPAFDTATDAGKLAARFVLGVLEGDRREAVKRIHEAVDGGMAVRAVYRDVLIPAAQVIGRMWHRGEISIGEEHFATDTTQLVMSQLLARVPLPAPNGKTVVAGTVTGDRHALGLRVVCDFFEMDGWRTICLGPDLPRSDVVQAALVFHADLVVLSATLHTHLKTLEQTIAALRQLPAPVPVLVGGYAFAEDREVAETIGADACAADADEAVRFGRGLVKLD